MRKILKMNRKMITRDNDTVMFKILKKIRLKKFQSYFLLKNIEICSIITNQKTKEGKSKRRQKYKWNKFFQDLPC